MNHTKSKLISHSAMMTKQCMNSINYYIIKGSFSQYEDMTTIKDKVKPNNNAEIVFCTLQN